MKRRVLYQLLTDRFAADGGRAIRGLSRTGPAGRWLKYAGGTYDGIARRLGYLQELGVSALWISPLPENSWIPPDRSRPHSDGYHGYWARDFERLNPSFGDEKSLGRLLEKASEHDFKLVLDIVLNHSNPTYSSDKGDLYRDGELFASYFGEHRGAFHRYGDLDQSKDYEPFAWENHNVWGLADLAQESSEVSEYLKRVHSRWLSMGFQGVRLDTALHMPADWIGEWVRHVREQVPECDFFFGEWWNGGPHCRVSSRASRTAGIHLTDFGWARTVRGWLSGEKSFAQLLKCVELQDEFLDPDLKVNFIDNHDMPRLRNVLSRNGASEHAVEFYSNLATVLLLFWRGVPCLYYGTEVGLVTRRRARGKKLGDDPYNREPMRFPREKGRLFEIIRTLCRLRRETDLTEHRLNHVSLQNNRHVFERGKVSLSLTLDKPDGKPVEGALKVDRTTLWSETVGGR